MSTDVQDAPATETASNVKGAAKILEIGPYPPPYDGWSMRLWVVRTGVEEAGHDCVPLNLGINRKTPSDDYECVRSGWEYLRKLVAYGCRGYTFHKHTNGDSLKGFCLDLVAYGVSLMFLRRPILTFHAGTDQVFFPRARSRWLVPFFKFFLFGTAKAIICNNRKVAQCIIDYGVTPKKVFPISPFTKQYLDLPPQELSTDLEDFLATRSPIILTYVECREEYDLKNLLWVVGKLAAEKPELGIVIVGAVRERATIQSMLETAGITDRSLHVGAVDHADFLTLLRRVALYLRCNEREGTSSSIREALHFGVPVVANKSASQPDAVLTYPWGNRSVMLEQAEKALSQSAGARLERDVLAEVPDTVAEEVSVLVRCALGRGVATDL